MTKQVSHWSSMSGTVSIAMLRKLRLTTATCSSTGSAMAPKPRIDEQIRKCIFRFRARIGAIEHLGQNQHRKTRGADIGQVARAVDQAARRVEIDGQKRATVITKPVWITPDHIRASITRPVISAARLLPGLSGTPIRHGSTWHLPGARVERLLPSCMICRIHDFLNLRGDPFHHDFEALP